MADLNLLAHLLQRLTKVAKGYQAVEVQSLSRIHQLKVTLVLTWLVISGIIWLLRMF